VSVDSPLDLGAAPTNRADDESLWWRHERLHRAVMRDPERLGPLFLAERDEIESAWLADPPDSQAAFAEADRLLVHWTAAVLAASAADTRPRFVQRYWRKRNAKASLQFKLSGPKVAGTLRVP
jgi:hypothetical protein